MSIISYVRRVVKQQTCLFFSDVGVRRPNWSGKSEVGVRRENLRISDVDVRHQSERKRDVAKGLEREM